MNFGQASEELKKGKTVKRSEWDSSGMFVYLLPPGVAVKNIDGVVTSWSPNENDKISEDWVALG